MHVWETNYGKVHQEVYLLWWTVRHVKLENHWLFTFVFCLWDQMNLEVCFKSTWTVPVLISSREAVWENFTRTTGAHEHLTPGDFQEVFPLLISTLTLTARLRAPSVIGWGGERLQIHTAWPEGQKQTSGYTHIIIDNTRVLFSLWTTREENLTVSSFHLNLHVDTSLSVTLHILRSCLFWMHVVVFSSLLFSIGEKKIWSQWECLTK